MDKIIFSSGANLKNENSSDYINAMISSIFPFHFRDHRSLLPHLTHPCLTRHPHFMAEIPCLLNFCWPFHLAKKKGGMAALFFPVPG